MVTRVDEYEVSKLNLGSLEGETWFFTENGLLVAEKFGKEHKHVLDVIREIVKGYVEFSADPMFEETTYVNKQNGKCNFNKGKCAIRY